MNRNKEMTWLGGEEVDCYGQANKGQCAHGYDKKLEIKAFS